MYGHRYNTEPGWTCSTECLWCQIGRLLDGCQQVLERLLVSGLYQLSHDQEDLYWLRICYHKVLASCLALQPLQNVINFWTRCSDMLCNLRDADRLHLKLYMWLQSRQSTDRLQSMLQASSSCLSQILGCRRNMTCVYCPLKLHTSLCNLQAMSKLSLHRQVKNSVRKFSTTKARLKQ